ncbi:MAG: anti-sigma factor family protein [Nannocystales bacterium]
MSTSTNTGTDMVSAYLDDELEPDDAKAFEDLLESSPEVAEELADLQKVISLVGGLGEVQAPEDFYEKLNRRLRRRQIMQPQTTSWLSLIAVPLQLLSVVVILAVAALYMMSELDAAPASIEREVLIPVGTTDAPVGPSPVRP